MTKQTLSNGKARRHNERKSFVLPTELKEMMDGYCDGNGIASSFLVRLLLINFFELSEEERDEFLKKKWG